MEDSNTQPLHQVQVKVQPKHKALCAYLQHDLFSYLQEFKCSGKKPNQAVLDSICDAVETHPVVVFAKPGCGFCKRAKQVFADHYTDTPVHVVNGASPEYRVALSRVLGISTISFPMCYIQGSYIGGSDEVARLHSNDELTGKIQGERSPMAEFGKGMIKTRPVFCSMLAGSEASLANNGPCDSSTSKWYCFQTKSYAQVIRLMALFQVILMLIMLGCGESNTQIGTDIALVLATVLSVDLSLFVLFGSTPLTLFGNLSKWLVWNVKGDAVPCIPYKVVFVVYVLAFARMLATCSTFDNSLQCWQSDTEVIRASLIGGVVNSGALAIFRFWPGSLATGAVLKPIQYGIRLLCCSKDSGVEKNEATTPTDAKTV